MDISGSISAPIPYPGLNRRPSPSNQPPAGRADHPRQVTTSLPTTIKPEAGASGQRQRRFYASEQALSHSSRQALNQYRDAEYAGEPELLNRVDVYA